MRDRIYKFHYMNVKKAVEQIKENNFGKRAPKQLNIKERRLMFEAAKNFFVGDRVMLWNRTIKGNYNGINPNTEYIIKAIYLTNKLTYLTIHGGDISISDDKTNNKFLKSDTLFDPRDFSLVDPVTRLPTNIVWKNDEHGEAVRVSSLSGTIIPKPYKKYISKNIYTAFLTDVTDFDTSPEAALNATFKPSLKFPHEEILKEMNIPLSYNFEEKDIRNVILNNEKDSKQEETNSN